MLSAPGHVSFGGSSGSRSISPQLHDSVSCGERGSGTSPKGGCSERSSSTLQLSPLSPRKQCCKLSREEVAALRRRRSLQPGPIVYVAALKDPTAEGTDESQGKQSPQDVASISTSGAAPVSPAQTKELTEVWNCLDWFHDRLVAVELGNVLDVSNFEGRAPGYAGTPRTRQSTRRGSLPAKVEDIGEAMLEQMLKTDAALKEQATAARARYLSTRNSKEDDKDAAALAHLQWKVSSFDVVMRQLSMKVAKLAQETLELSHGLADSVAAQVSTEDKVSTLQGKFVDLNARLSRGVGDLANLDSSPRRGQAKQPIPGLQMPVPVAEEGEGGLEAVRACLLRLRGCVKQMPMTEKSPGASEISNFGMGSTSPRRATAFTKEAFASWVSYWQGERSVASKKANDEPAEEGLEETTAEATRDPAAEGEHPDIAESFTESEHVFSGNLGGEDEGQIKPGEVGDICELGEMHRSSREDIIGGPVAARAVADQEDAETEQRSREEIVVGLGTSREDPDGMDLSEIDGRSLEPSTPGTDRMNQIPLELEEMSRKSMEDIPGIPEAGHMKISFRENTIWDGIPAVEEAPDIPNSTAQPSTHFDVFNKSVILRGLHPL